MLTSFRQGGIAKIFMFGVVALIIAAFAFSSNIGGGGASAANVCVVEVEGSCVEPAQYNALLRLVAPPGASNKQLRKLGFTQHAVSAFVERELLLREARRLGVAVSDDELDDQLALGRVHFSWPTDAPIPQALAAGRSFPTTGSNETATYLAVNNTKTGKFDFKKYQRQVQRIMRMSNKDFKRYQRDEMVAARVRAMVTGPVRVSEKEVFTQFERQRSTATARTVSVEAKWFAAFSPAISDEAATAYAAANKEDVDKAWEKAKAKWTADCSLVSELLFRYPAGADEDDKVAAKTQADAALAMLTSGVPFGTAARVHGDAATAAVGGFVGCLVESAGPGAKAALPAVQKLAAGQKTAAIESPQGLHIYYSEGKLAAADVEKRGRLEVARSLAAKAQGTTRAQEFAKALIKLGASGTLLADATTQLRAEYVSLAAPEANQAALVELAVEQKLAPAMEISRTFTRASSPVFGVKGSVNAAALVFALEKVNEYVAEPVETHKGFSVLQLKEKTVATQEKFAEQKVDLMAAVRQHKRAEVLSQFVARLRARAKNVKIHPEFSGQVSAASEASTKKSESTPASSG